MRILPVLDVQGGRAVHAVAGDRARYQPLASQFAPGSSDPRAIARGLHDAGATELYLADLDAIGGRAGPDLDLYRAIAAWGLRLWVDAGVAGDGSTVARLAEVRAAVVVVGLESGAGPVELGRIAARLGPERVAWSLDLRHGVPIVPTAAAWAGDHRDPTNLAAQAIRAGVRRIIRLDLACVGTGGGVDHLPTVEPDGGVEWLAGGGVRGPGDLLTLAERGYAGVLVGSALHDGRIGLAGGPAPGSGALSGHRTS